MRLMRLALLGGAALLAGCATAQVTTVAPVAPAPPLAPVAPAPERPSNWTGMQWSYGSGEAAAASLGLFNAMGDLVADRVRKRPADSVILADPLALGGGMVPCGKKPLAIVLDVDETAIQNSGYEYQLARRGKSSDGPLLDRWQSSAQSAALAMPGATEMVARAAALGVTPIFISNRDAPASSQATAETLARLGFPKPVPGDTLLLRGDVDGKSGKDGRRGFVGVRYCVIAMAGDTLGDFSDTFNDRTLSGVRQRRQLAERMGQLWGHGWFMVSNPVYGAQLRGDLDEVFAPDERWNGE